MSIEDRIEEDLVAGVPEQNVLALDSTIAVAATEIQRGWTCRERRKRSVEKRRHVSLMEFGMRDLGLAGR